MATAVQKIIEEDEFYSPIPQKPYEWLMRAVSDGACALWVFMLMQPSGFNHYPKTLAQRLGVNVRTIQRRLNELARVGAIFKISKPRQQGKLTVFYYRPILIPKEYRAQRDQENCQQPQTTPAAPVPAAPKRLVDNSCKRPVQKMVKTSNVSPLVRLNIKNPVYTPCKPHTHTHIHDNTSGSERVIDYKKHFDELCAHYPAHKVPVERGYLNACYKLFVQEMHGHSQEYIALATDHCIEDVKLRVNHCYHWLIPEEQPSLWSYLKHRRWQLPIQFSAHEQDKIKREFDSEMPTSMGGAQ